MAEKNMNAKISVEFEETANRQQLSSGDNLPTLFGKIKKIISDLSTSAFSGSYNDLTDTPEIPTITIDSELSDTSENAVQNKVIKNELDKKLDDYNVTAQGNPVTLNGLQEGVPFSEVTVSGKNLIKFPYADPRFIENGNTFTENGMTFTVNNDNSLTINGTAQYNMWFIFDNTLKMKPLTTYTLSGGLTEQVGGILLYINIFNIKNQKLGHFPEDNKYNPDGVIFTTVEGTVRGATAIQITEGYTFDNVVIYPQLEIGDTPTEYVPSITTQELTVTVNNTDYTITPDSNPYTVPTEIYQQDGINTVYVTGEGEPTLSVTGVKENITIKKIWNNLTSNVQSDWDETEVNSSAYILNKPESLPASDVSDWAKSPTKPIYTAEEIGLGNVENKNSATIRGELTKANVTDALGYTPPESDTTYTHPSYTAKSSGLYKVTVDNKGHVSATTAVTKADITALGIPDTNTTYNVATTSANGLMSSTDKTKLNATNIAYGTCDTAAATAAKIVSISGNTNWTLATGSIISVKFTNTNSAQNPTLNVNNTGAKSIVYNASVITTSSLTYAGYAGRTSLFIYNGSQYVFAGWSIDNNTTYGNMTAATASAAGKSGLVPAPAAGKQTSFLRGDGTWVVPTNTTYSNFVKSGSGAKAGLVPAPSTTAGTTKYLREDGTWQVPPDTNTTYTPMSLGFGYGTCTTAAATTAKVASLASYTLVKNGIVSIKFTNAVPANATLNVNSKGAKAIYYRGSAITAGIINAGDIATLIYDGSQYHLLTVDRSDYSVKTYTVNITTTDWTTNANGGYIATKTVTGVQTTDSIIADLVCSTDIDAAKLQIIAWSCICNGDIIISDADTITFYTYETKPTTAITVELKVSK